MERSHQNLGGDGKHTTLRSPIILLVNDGEGHVRSDEE